MIMLITYVYFPISKAKVEINLKTRKKMIIGAVNIYEKEL